jgi:uncharacterized SAM-binding protein YcdF (DUF218 family)
VTMTETLSAREQFAAVLYTGPLLKSDAIIVLCGEDADPRVDVAAQLLMTGGAPRIVLSGGKHKPPRWQGAEALRATLMGKGIAHDRIILESASQHTREQAVNVVSMAMSEGWRRLLLVASSYHMPRAFLTFVRVLTEHGQEQVIRVVPVPASHSAWGASPAGMSLTRMELLGIETRKAEEYRPHVASYEDGLAYHEWWEGR